MSCYFMAFIDIHDPEEYERYLVGTDEVFGKYNGQYLAVDFQPEVLEGHPPTGRAVLIRFPGREDLLAWYHSPEYQHILKHRLKAAHCNSVMFQGNA